MCKDKNKQEKKLKDMLYPMPEERILIGQDIPPDDIIEPYRVCPPLTRSRKYKKNS